MHRPRAIILALAVAGVAAAGAASPAYAAFASETTNGSDSIVASCNTQATGQEVIPTVNSQGVTLPEVTVPAVVIPQVTVGKVTVGPFSEGPFSEGPFPVGGTTVGGGTILQEHQPNYSEVSDAAGCYAVDVTNPLAPLTMSAPLCRQLFAQELTGLGLQFEAYDAGPECPFLLGPVAATSEPVIHVPGVLQAGTATAQYNNLPTAGALAPDGGTYTGVYQEVAGVTLTINGVNQGSSPTCSGYYDCSSTTFTVF